MLQMSPTHTLTLSFRDSPLRGYGANMYHRPLQDAPDSTVAQTRGWGGRLGVGGPGPEGGAGAAGGGGDRPRGRPPLPRVPPRGLRCGVRRRRGGGGNGPAGAPVKAWGLVRRSLGVDHCVRLDPSHPNKQFIGIVLLSRKSLCAYGVSYRRSFVY